MFLKWIGWIFDLYIYIFICTCIYDTLGPLGHKFVDMDDLLCEIGPVFLCMVSENWVHCWTRRIIPQGNDRKQTARICHSVPFTGELPIWSLPSAKRKMREWVNKQRKRGYVMNTRSPKMGHTGQGSSPEHYFPLSSSSPTKKTEKNTNWDETRPPETASRIRVRRGVSTH